MHKRLTLLCLSILFCTVLAGCQCEHQWTEATCTTPKTCSLCDEIEGEALGHNWIPATCEAPETCSCCNETQGNATGHNWLDATCTDPQTCSVCEESQGTALGHTEGDWELDEESRDIISGTIWRRKYCLTCNNSIDSELRSFPLYDNEHFLFSPNEFEERLSKIYEYIDNNNYSVNMIAYDDTMGCVVSGSESIAAIMFLSDDNILTATGVDSHEVDTIVASYYTDDLSHVVNVMIGIMVACDNTLEVSDAADIGKQIIVSSYLGEPYYNNGLGYVFGDDGDGYKLIVSVSDK